MRDAMGSENRLVKIIELYYHVDIRNMNVRYELISDETESTRRHVLEIHVKIL